MDFKKLKRTIRSTYMCIKYPFLYPRNRFTGLHYNNWKLHKYHVDNYKKAVGCFCIHVYNVSDCKFSIDYLTLAHYPEFDATRKVEVKIIDKEVVFMFGGKILYRHKILTGNEDDIFKYGFKLDGKNMNLYIIYKNDVEIPKEESFHIKSFVINRWLYFKIKVADFLNDYVLQLFHCIPTYTEWDALEYGLPGWYKAFGKKLLHEMAKQLKKDKMLYSFRITDIKEKWGSLQIYCGAASKEMYALLHKYENLSYHTCITCGKPAKYLSNGWICPYCEEHFKDEIYKPYAVMSDEGKWEYTPIEEEEDE